uniref:Uncharacterized protein n=1 Tax=Glossina austeni TaxID=7395 RepID=A0A1A9VX03_GLOAU
MFKNPFSVYMAVYDKNPTSGGSGGVGVGGIHYASDVAKSNALAYRGPFSPAVYQQQQQQQQQQQKQTLKHSGGNAGGAVISQQNIVYAVPHNSPQNRERNPHIQSALQQQHEQQVHSLQPQPVQHVVRAALPQPQKIQYVIAIPMSYLRQLQQQLVQQQQQQQQQLHPQPQHVNQPPTQQALVASPPITTVGGLRFAHRFSPSSGNDITPVAGLTKVPSLPGYTTQLVQIPTSVLVAAAQAAAAYQRPNHQPVYQQHSQPIQPQATQQHYVYQQHAQPPKHPQSPGQIIQQGPLYAIWATHGYEKEHFYWNLQDPIKKSDYKLYCFGGGYAYIHFVQQPPAGVEENLNYAPYTQGIPGNPAPLPFIRIAAPHPTHYYPFLPPPEVQQPVYVSNLPPPVNKVTPFANVALPPTYANQDVGVSPDAGVAGPVRYFNHHGGVQYGNQIFHTLSAPTASTKLADSTATSNVQPKQLHNFLSIPGTATPALPAAPKRTGGPTAAAESQTVAIPCSLLTNSRLSSLGVSKCGSHQAKPKVATSNEWNYFEMEEHNNSMRRALSFASDK